MAGGAAEGQTRWRSSRGDSARGTTGRGGLRTAPRRRAGAVSGLGRADVPGYDQGARGRGWPPATTRLDWRIVLVSLTLRPARRRLRGHRRRLDRLLVRQPPHLVRLEGEAGHDREGPLRRAERRRREVAGAAHRGHRERQKHVLALDEMATTEKAHGYISRATDQDPYLSRVREAVAREAESYGASYPEGQGSGLRYTAFDRHASIARQTVARLQESQRTVADFQAGLKPLGPRGRSYERSGRSSTPSPGRTCARRCTRRSRCRRCPSTPRSWTTRRD